MISLSRFSPFALQARVDDQIAALTAALNELELRTQGRIAAASLGLRERIGLRLAQQGVRTRRQAKKALARDMDVDLAELRRRYPKVFPIWSRLFDNAKAEYLERPNTSLSVASNPGADAFRKYLAGELTGHVLDIGCGPLELPHYLVGQNVERIAGIDPLAGAVSRRFEFVRGLAEFLPWPDAEFDCVVIGTSLDHVISLDMVFSEIRRVLAPGGVVCMWVGFVKGAKEYDPSAEDIEPIDDFHIFHFDRPWFLDLVGKYFVVSDELPIDGVSFFYSLRSK